ncbi:MAG: ABC transporter permease subunit [Deltaproteobacteria bacterium]|nr:ABC transporter permease subunit [Deltaproteobacteria bacterium]
MSSADGSRIRDIGYAAYDGRRLPHSSRFAVLGRNTLSLFWKSGLVKTIFILGMIPLVICAVVMFLKMSSAAALRSRQLPVPDMLQNAEFWIFNCAFWCQIWFCFAMSLVAGTASIADDVRTGALHFYFARPVSKSHYVVGKLLAVGTLVGGLVLLPALLMASMPLLFSDGVELTVGTKLGLMLGALAYGLIATAALTLPAIALSSLTSKSSYAMGGWTALFFLPWVLGEGTASVANTPYLALLSIPTNLRVVGGVLMGRPQEIAIPWLWSVIMLVLFSIAALALLWRQLDRAEIIK